MLSLAPIVFLMACYGATTEAINNDNNYYNLNNHDATYTNPPSANARSPGSVMYPRMQTYTCKGSKGATVSVIDLDPHGKGVLPFPDDTQGEYILFQHGYSQGVIESSDDLDLTNDIIVVIHGLESKIEEIYQSLIDELFSAKPRADVLFIDWMAASGSNSNGTLLESMTYERVVSNTRVVGGCLARWLEANRYFDASKSYCLGLGLGGHICGFAGKTFTRGKWGRITALDPLEREFNLGDYSRVSRNDTAFLDVIHTTCLSYSFGIGHVDYFVNNVKASQPGCRDTTCNPTGSSAAVRKTCSSCSHIRALKIFISSINDKCCLSFCSWHSAVYCRQMGFWAYNYPYDKVGNFYGNLTAQEEPFCVFTASGSCYSSTNGQIADKATAPPATTKMLAPTKWYENMVSQTEQPGPASRNTNGCTSLISVDWKKLYFYCTMIFYLSGLIMLF